MEDMIMKKVCMISIIASVALVFSIQDAEARHGRGGPMMGKRGGHGVMKALKTLNLTEQQEIQIQALKHEKEKQKLPLWQQLKKKRMELRDLWKAVNPSKNAIMAKHDEMEPLRKQMLEMKVDFRLSVLEVLTPEQRTALSEIMDRECDGPHCGPGHRRGSGHGHQRGFGYGGSPRGSW
jgi:Spy/CpxP family protein refolding chaperone